MSEKGKTLYQQEVARLYGEHPYRSQQFQQIRHSKRYMDNFHCERIELEDLAQAAFMSRSHFARSFQKIYGQTPRLFLRDFRINKAKELLAQGQAITEVCYCVGYESLPTFSAVFKKCTGQSPREYQQSNKSNPE